MKIRLTLLTIFLLSFAAFAQYRHVSIRDIQYQNPDSLKTYFEDDKAPGVNGGTVNNGDTVSVTGIVMCASYQYANPDSTVLMYAGGGALGVFLQDTSGTDWAGIFFRQTSTTGAFANLDTGMVVTVTGVVDEYSSSTQKTTQLDVINFDASNIIDIKTRPQPVMLTLDSLKDISDAPKAIAEKWEGVYVEIKNVTTANSSSSGGFSIFDSNNLTLNIGTKSDYYYTPSGGQTAPSNGTKLDYIRGFIETRSVGSNGITLNPAYPNDMKVATFPPSISNVVRDTSEVHFGRDVKISADIIDNDGTVVGANLNYRINEGSTVTIPLTQETSSNTWTATIPGQNDSSRVDYYITAKDNDNNVSIAPSDTSRNRYFYFVLNRPLRIQDVQYTPFTGGYTAYYGYKVTVSGVVTSDTSDFNQVYIQNGQGPWSGIRINGTEAIKLERGDNVTVTGTVGLSDVAQISGLDNPSTITINSHNNKLPDPQVLTTADIAKKSVGTISAAQWEDVLIQYENIVVSQENADGSPGVDEGSGGNRNFGEMYVDDGSGETRVLLQTSSPTDYRYIYHNGWDSTVIKTPNMVQVKNGDKFSSLTGILYYSYGNYKLAPRNDNDFNGYVPVVVNEVKNNFPSTYTLEQNYPNPFNPSTTIMYSIPREGLVTLNVYNILGQKISTLVNMNQRPGTYQVTFDASNLSSGVYFYQLKAGNFQVIKKMMLIK